MRREQGRIVLVLALVGGLLAVPALMGANNSCVPIPEGCVTHDDCGAEQYCDAGACATLGACETAADCEDQPLIVPLCLGHFTCDFGLCNWNCGAAQTACDPAEELSCGDDEVCLADSIDEEGLCRPFQHGSTVGAGYACGGSIGVGCAEGLYCKGLPYGVDGGSGVCTLMDCNDWFAEYLTVTEYLSRCTSSAECAAIPGTSCGCTRNLVLSENADMNLFWAIYDAMNAGGCGLVSTCDCPAADGFVCDNGHCAWNYL